MDFGHATFGTVTRLVPTAGMAVTRNVLGARVTGTTLIACRKRKGGNTVVHGPRVSAILCFRHGRLEWSEFGRVH